MRRAAEFLGNTQFTQELYQQFIDAGYATESYSVLDRAFYWDEGQYELKLCVYAVNPDRVFDKTWTCLLLYCLRSGTAGDIHLS